MGEEFIVVFDLDDTLYLERDFAKSGFDAVGAWFKEEYGIEGLGERCQDLYDAGKTTKVFDQALRSLNFKTDAALIQKLVKVYRLHPPTISLTPDAARYFERSRGRSHAMITDGPVATQRAKIKALGLTPHFEIVICTDAWGVRFRKPHPHAFKTLEKLAVRSAHRLVYVADNPTKDFVTPKGRGWATVQIARLERVHVLQAPDDAHEAHATIETLDVLDECLARMASQLSAQSPTKN